MGGSSDDEPEPEHGQRQGRSDEVEEMEVEAGVLSMVVDGERGSEQTREPTQEEGEEQEATQASVTVVEEEEEEVEEEERTPRSLRTLRKRARPHSSFQSQSQSQSAPSSSKTQSVSISASPSPRRSSKRRSTANPDSDMAISEKWGLRSYSSISSSYSLRSHGEPRKGTGSLASVGKRKRRKTQ